MADGRTGGGVGGISLGGILVIVGIVLMIVWSFWIGLIILLAVWVLNIVFSIIAAIKANQGQFYTYPIAIKFVS